MGVFFDVCTWKQISHLSLFTKDSPVKRIPLFGYYFV